MVEAKWNPALLWLPVVHEESLNIPSHRGLLSEIRGKQVFNKSATNTRRYFKYTVGTFILTLLKDISPCLMIWYKNQTHHTFPVSLSTSRAIRNLYNMNICFWNKNYKLSDNKNTQINWTLNEFLMKSFPFPPIT